MTSSVLSRPPVGTPRQFWALRLVGPLDLPALRRALSTVDIPDPVELERSVELERPGEPASLAGALGRPGLYRLGADQHLLVATSPGVPPAGATRRRLRGGGRWPYPR